MLYYLVIGFVIVAALAIAFGVAVTFIISVIIVALYGVGFIVLVVKVRRINNELLIRIHFNLALVLRNENGTLYLKHGIRASPGFLSRWIEF